MTITQTRRHVTEPWQATGITDRERIDMLVAAFRERDVDPAFAGALVLDAYARISKDEDGNTEKTDRQLVDVLSAMYRDGYRLGRILVDNNFSAWKRNRKRPGWDVLLERLGKESNGVYAWHIDRLLRQPFDLEILIKTAEDGIIVASCHGDYHLRTSEGRTTLRILVTMACKSSDDTARRARRKNLASREAGIMQQGDGFGHGSGPTVAAEREFIAWAIQFIVDGNDVSWKRCADEANRLGITSRNGHSFNALKVRTVLNHPRHAGLVAYENVETGHRLADDTVAIVSVELWREFQAVLAGRKRGRPQSTEHYPLSGLVRCECGFSLTGTSQKGYKGNGRIRAYRCGVHGCGKNYANADALEAWAETRMLDVLSDPRAARIIARKAKALGRAQLKLAALEKREKAIAEKLTDLRYDSDPLLQAVDTLRAQIEAAKAECRELEHESDGSSTPYDRAELAYEYGQADREGQRTFLAQAFAEAHRIMVLVDRDAPERFRQL